MDEAGKAGRREDNGWLGQAAVGYRIS